jgi:hypothetical protein
VSVEIAAMNPVVRKLELNLIGIDKSNLVDAGNIVVPDPPIIILARSYLVRIEREVPEFYAIPDARNHPIPSRGPQQLRTSFSGIEYQ